MKCYSLVTDNIFEKESWLPWSTVLGTSQAVEETQENIPAECRKAPTASPPAGLVGGDVVKASQLPQQAGDRGCEEDIL